MTPHLTFSYTTINEIKAVGSKWAVTWVQTLNMQFHPWWNKNRSLWQWTTLWQVFSFCANNIISANLQWLKTVRLSHQLCKDSWGRSHVSTCSEARGNFGDLKAIYGLTIISESWGKFSELKEKFSTHHSERKSPFPRPFSYLRFSLSALIYIY